MTTTKGKCPKCGSTRCYLRKKDQMIVCFDANCGAETPRVQPIKKNGG